MKLESEEKEKEEVIKIREEIWEIVDRKTREKSQQKWKLFCWKDKTNKQQTLWSIDDVRSHCFKADFQDLPRKKEKMPISKVKNQKDSIIKE